MAETTEPLVPPLQASAPLQPALPRFAQLEPVGRCNLACRMCTVHDRGDEVGQMSLQRFAALLDQMPDLQELHLQGLGEPMLHPDFFEMVSLAVRRGIRVSANTNLTLLTPERARSCVDSGLAALSVSLDGASAAVYEDIRRKASFAKVIRNLKRLVDARDAAGSALEVRGVMVLMRGNLEELPALLRLLHNHRVSELLVQRLSSDLRQTDLPTRYIPIRSYVNDAELRPQDLARAAEVFAEARALANALGMQLHLPRLTSIKETLGEALPKCRWPWDQLYITAAGEMLPCCMVATADRATFGRVFPSDHGVAERWHGPAAQSFRQSLLQGTPPQVCSACALYHGMF